MKIAIVHDWLVVSGGAEKVLQRITECFPSADIFTLVDFLEDRQFLDNHRVRASFIQKMPFAKKHSRNNIALMPLAIEQFDLSEYDLIISSSYAVAKGVLTGRISCTLAICILRFDMHGIFNISIYAKRG